MKHPVYKSDGSMSVCVAVCLIITFNIIACVVFYSVECVLLRDKLHVSFVEVTGTVKTKQSNPVSSVGSAGTHFNISGTTLFSGG